MGEELVIEVSTVRCIRCAWIALLACALIAGGAAAGIATLPDSEACLSLMSDLRFESAEYEPDVHHFIATPKGMRYNHDLVMNSACHESMKRQFANANDAASRRKLQSTDFTFGELNDVCVPTFGLISAALQSFQLTTINNVSKLVWELTTPKPCCDTYGYLCIKEALGISGVYTLQGQDGDVCVSADSSDQATIYFYATEWKPAKCCKYYLDFDGGNGATAEGYSCTPTSVVARYGLGG